MWNILTKYFIVYNDVTAIIVSIVQHEGAIINSSQRVNNVNITNSGKQTNNRSGQAYSSKKEIHSGTKSLLLCIKLPSFNSLRTCP